MSVFVKICGVTDEASLEAAVDAGADAVGFVFHAPSPRHLSPRRAAVLAARLPGGVLAVAVTLQPGQREVDQVLEAFMPDAWQSDAASLARLRLPGGIRGWPVMRGGDGAAQPLPARLVFDGPESGRGRRANWDEAAAIARRTELILGGGLDAGNVAEAIAVVRPYGVDVSSGVERAPGAKDARLIREFVRTARAGLAA
jgi:phosphoribosylanthranilate isomerase